MSTANKRSVTVQTLLKQGFRIQFSNTDMTVLVKPASASTMHIAQVDPEGQVNKSTLPDFLETILT
jgi:hypothetical protein